MTVFAVRTEVVVLSEDSLHALLRSFAARLEPCSSEFSAQLDSASFIPSRNDAVMSNLAEP